MCITIILISASTVHVLLFPIASFHIRPQEFYYRKIRYERHDVASGGASGTKFCMAVNGKNAGSAC